MGRDTRRRLSREYENLGQVDNRNRIAAENIRLENMEDQGDLAIIRHDTVAIRLHEANTWNCRSR